MTRLVGMAAAIACSCLLLLACGRRPAPAPIQTGPPDAAPIASAWAARRAEDARARLAGSPAGVLLWDAIEAHGGLARWLRHGTIEFDFDYGPLDRPERRMNTHNRVDVWRSRATQRELGEGADAELGWDGERAWIRPNPAAFPSPARFWATTPFYFVGIPFVLADPGVRLDQLPDAELDGVAHRIVKATFEPGTGDSPDDYYVLYLHPSTHRLSALRYVVAYPGFFPPGGRSPEKLMRYGGLHEVHNTLMPSRLDTFAWSADTATVGAQVTAVQVQSVRFGRSWPAAIFAPPDGAVTFRTVEPVVR